jgi:hypothetical protein
VASGQASTEIWPLQTHAQTGLSLLRSHSTADDQVIGIVHGARFPRLLVPEFLPPLHEPWHVQAGLEDWSTRSAYEPNEPLGWAEIRHPFHPRRGQRFPVQRAAGIDTLVLRGLEHGSSVLREWTDWADPDSCPDDECPSGNFLYLRKQGSFRPEAITSWAAKYCRPISVSSAAPAPDQAAPIPPPHSALP